MVSRNYSNTLMKQLFCVFFTKLFPAAAFAVFATRVALYLNDSELKTPLVTSKSASLAGDSSLLNCQKHLDVSEYLSLYSIKLYIGIAMSIWFASSINTSLIPVLYVENGAQCLNATCVSLFAATVISYVTKINASEELKRLDLILSVSNLIQLFLLNVGSIK